MPAKKKTAKRAKKLSKSKKLEDTRPLTFDPSLHFPKG